MQYLFDEEHLSFVGSKNGDLLWLVALPNEPLAERNQEICLKLICPA